MIPLRGTGQFNPDGVRDYDLLVPARPRTLTVERHAADRERYLEEAARWREAYAAEHGVDGPGGERPSGRRPGSGGADAGAPPADDRAPASASTARSSARSGRASSSCSGVGPDDDEATADALARRVDRAPDLRRRRRPDEPLAVDVGGAALVVSQFTLYADTRRGRRPGFTGAAAPELAERLYLRFAAALRALGVEVATGRFGAVMAVELVNDGPFTIWLDTADR